MRGDQPGDQPGDRPGLRSVEEHLEAILADVEPLPAFTQPLVDALGLACVDEITSGMSLPRFDNSAMDGYAVHRGDVVTACEESPVKLPVIGEIGAGQVGVEELPAGTAAKIMTGGPIPRGADAVVPYEWTDRGAREVWIARAPREGQHVRAAGEDVGVGDVLVDPGTTLGPRQLGLLASVGHGSIRVRPRPRVVVVSTGTELRDPGSPLGPGEIYDGNSYLLAAAVRRAGGIPTRVGRVADDPDAFLGVLDGHLGRADAVVTSGGVSMGDFDVVKAALTERGVWFGPVAMQPGKPQGFGLLPVNPEAEAPRRVPVFTLPGNPVSAYLSFELFVRPALRRMMGLTPLSRTPVRARLTHAVASPPGRRQYLRGVLTYGEDGVRVAEIEPVGGSGSHLVGDLASADALIVVPEDVTTVAAGEQVTVIRLDDER